MEAAFDSPFDDRRYRQRTDGRRASLNQSVLGRSVSGESLSGKPLTEPEFERAVCEGMPQLIAIARRLSGNEELATEAVQNALLKASKSWRWFRGQSHVQTWLTQIVIHCVRDAIAANRRRLEKQPMLPQSESHRPGESVVDPDGGPRQKLLDDELRQTIRTAVQQLPDRQREVFGLTIWQGMTAAEVGKLLDISPQTVHANLHAARKRLRELLGHFVNDAQD